MFPEFVVALRKRPSRGRPSSLIAAREA